MEEKKGIKISLSIFFLILAIIVMVVMAYFLYKFYHEKTIAAEKVSALNNQVSNLENTIDNLQGKINSISNTINNSETAINSNSQNKTENSSVSYVILELEDTEADGLDYKSKKITDDKKIDLLMEIIDRAVEYKEKSFIADFGDMPPCAKIYLSNGESYTVAAGDQIDDNGDTVNLMTKWYTEDGSDKTLYKVNKKLGEQIEKLFNE